MNPYQWNRHNPASVETPALGRLWREMAGGGLAILVGGHGMGKSATFQWVRDQAEKSNFRAIYLPMPPLQKNVKGCMDTLIRAIGTPPREELSDLLRVYFERSERLGLVLLYDEVDKYPDSLRQEWFDHLAAAHKEHPRLAVAVAGGLGALKMDRLVGSPFSSRAERRELSPLSSREFSQLARPLLQRNPHVAVEEIHLLSGGNPALGTWFLQQLWDRPEAGLPQLAGEFLAKHRDFIRACQSHFMGPEVQPAFLMLQDIVSSNKEVTVKQLKQLPTENFGGDWERLLSLFQAAGILACRQDYISDFVSVYPIFSLIHPHWQQAGARWYDSDCQRVAPERVEYLQKSVRNFIKSPGM